MLTSLALEHSGDHVRFFRKCSTTHRTDASIRGSGRGTWFAVGAPKHVSNCVTNLTASSYALPGWCAGIHDGVHSFTSPKHGTTQGAWT